MDKLTLEVVAPYLPYGVRVKVGKTERNLTTVSLDSPFVFVSAWQGSREKEMISIEDVKPILRPLSDLTKEIEHKGVSFIPLLLLAKIENYENNYLDDDENGVPIIGKDVSDFDMGSMTYAHTYRFRFDEELKLFVVDLLDEDGSMISEAMNIATRNFDLIKKLYEWHFDVFGLIEKGLAIDINSIEGKETKGNG